MKTKYLLGLFLLASPASPREAFLDDETDRCDTPFPKAEILKGGGGDGDSDADSSDEEEVEQVAQQLDRQIGFKQLPDRDAKVVLTLPNDRTCRICKDSEGHTRLQCIIL